MSAWIVTREHIDVLVTALEPDCQERGDLLGRVLWHENLRSVADRYPDDTGEDDRPGPIGFRDTDVTTYTWTPRVVPVTWVRSAIHCYDYQSCEHDGWNSSSAKVMVTELLSAIGDEAMPPRDYSRPCAADNPPWGIDADNLAQLAANS